MGENEDIYNTFNKWGVEAMERTLTKDVKDQLTGRGKLFRTMRGRNDSGNDCV